MQDSSPSEQWELLLEMYPGSDANSKEMLEWLICVMTVSFRYKEEIKQRGSFKRKRAVSFSSCASDSTKEEESL